MRSDCTCSHPHDFHLHFRYGLTYCGTCGGEVCPRYRSTAIVRVKAGGLTIFTIVMCFGSSLLVYVIVADGLYFAGFAVACLLAWAIRHYARHVIRLIRSTHTTDRVVWSSERGPDPAARDVTQPRKRR